MINTYWVQRYNIILRLPRILGNIFQINKLNYVSARTRNDLVGYDRRSGQLRLPA